MDATVTGFSTTELTARFPRALDGEAPNLGGVMAAFPRPGQKGRLLQPAAVLVPIREHARETTVILTVRSIEMPAHAGQISFPGGRIAGGGESPVEAALREAEEEIGLAPTQVRVLGFLDAQPTGTGFVIAPVVGLVTGDFAPIPEAREVAAVFEVPLPFLMDPANHRVEEAESHGRRRRFHVMQYGEHRIWGATAGMLKNLYDRVYGPCSA